MAELLRLQGDVIVTGLPGVGKTRVLAELPDAWFVTGMSIDRIADGIRQLRPTRVILDDALTRPQVLDDLQSLRREEGLSYQLIVVGWPHEVDRLREHLGGAELFEVGLLAPETIDALLRDGGVTGIVARTVLLDQAAGRPGWAVTLAALTADDRAGLYSGSALLRQVRPLVRRLSADEDEGLAVLAAVAALEPASDEDLGAIGRLLGVSDPRVRATIRRSMAGGLLEGVRGGYGLRPDALRTALVAAWYFVEPPSSDFEALIAAFPSRRFDLLGSALSAAGSAAGARRHVDEAVDRGEFPPSWLPRYAGLDRVAAGRAIIEAGRAAIDARLHIEVLRIGSAYAIGEAIVGLLELAVGDDRPLHSHPDHPVRILSELATSIHPDMGAAFEARPRILGAATDWADTRDSEDTWDVYATLATRLLDPTVEGRYLDPVDRRQVVMRSGVEPPIHMRRMHDEVWLPVSRRLARLPDRAVSKLVHALDDWATIGAGHGGPMGQPVDDERMSAASEVATRIANDLAARMADKPALLWGLKRSVARYRLPVAIHIDPAVELLLWVPWGQRDGGAVERARTELRSLGESWVDDEPSERFALVGSLRSEASLVGAIQLPGLVIAMEALAEAVSDLPTWVRAALQSDVWPESRPLLERLVRERPADAEVPVRDALGAGGRYSAIAIALSAGVDARLADIVISSLEARDARQVNHLVAMERVESSLLERLLEHPVAEVRAAACFAFSVGQSRGGGPPVASALQEAWRRAFLDTATIATAIHVDFQVNEVLDDLLLLDAELLLDWLVRRVPVLRVGDLVPYHWEARLRELPRSGRDRLLRSIPHEWHAEALALLMGTDSAWVKELIETGAVATDDVVDALARGDGGGFDERVDVFEAIGPILLANSVDARIIVITAEYGTEWGESSVRYLRKANYFRGLATSDDLALAELGRAGIERYEPAHREALAAEERSRLRRET